MKKIISITLITALLFAITACSEIVASVDNTDATQSTEVETDGLEPKENKEVPSSSPTPIIIDDVKDGNYIRAILNELNTSRQMSEEERQNNGNYDMNRISEIENFYYPTIEIEGYELYKVLMFGGTFCFYYAPLNLTDKTDLCFSNGTAILLQIKRFDYEYDDIPPSPTIEQLSKIFDGKAINNDLFFAETIYNYNEFGGLLGDTWFSMNIPKSVDFKKLPEIGRQLIETAELVDVEHELKLMRDNAD